MNKDRLLNVAKACRETLHPTEFSLITFHKCGTPGCVLGNYAYRQDLQDDFMLGNESGLYKRGEATIGNLLWHGSDVVCNHFNINRAQADELFGLTGCGRARTAEEAADYIEDFVLRNC